MNEYLIYLLEILRERFNVSELRDLCFSLGIDYEGLEGNNKNDKARELILYLDRRHNLYFLIKYGKKHRPDIEWKYQVEKDGFVHCSPWVKTETPGSELAVYFTPKNYPCKLSVVRFFIPKRGQPTTNFEVRIYSGGVDKLPGDKVNQNPIYGRGNEYSSWVEIDISGDNINIEKGDFFVSMVWLTAPLSDKRGRNTQFLGAKSGSYPLRTYFKHGTNRKWDLHEYRHGLIEVVTEDGILLQNP